MFDFLLEGIRPAFGIPGGKKFLAKEIVSYIPEHKIYIEPFIGGGAVFFKKEPSEIEVINDKDSELIETYKFFKNASVNEIQKFKDKDWRIQKGLWKRLRDSEPMVQLERAYKFLYVREGSFGFTETSFSPSQQEDGRIIAIPKRFEKIRERLLNVKIENSDWINFIKKYNAEENFIYLDPPYPSGFSGKVYGDITNESLLENLKPIKAKWLLSLKDLPEVRKVFKEFSYKVVETLRVLNTTGERKTSKELLISNFPLKKINIYLKEEAAEQGGVYV